MPILVGREVTKILRIGERSEADDGLGLERG
jgi:hypothetical protein